MKTKIIYISGNEVFEMSEIRAAFEEVRCALGLDNDTILFGVPVDNDTALEPSLNTETEQQDNQYELTEETDDESQCVIEDEIEEIIQSPVCEQIITEPVADLPDDTNNNEFCNESIKKEAETPVILEENQEKIIPILSVLAANQDTELNTESEVLAENNQSFDTPIAITSVANIDEEVGIEPEQIETDTEQPTTVENTEGVEKITIGDMIDDAPVAKEEKTLEQLLESMTPLREDIGNPFHNETEEDLTDIVYDVDATDTDATLAQLASEFAENEDKIVSTPKAEPQGKIGKLKNILPFKKAKRDDSGLMGDLFGWAGIAANDDDFTMPGFFTGAKKQGA